MMLQIPETVIVNINKFDYINIYYKISTWQAFTRKVKAKTNWEKSCDL